MDTLERNWNKHLSPGPGNLGLNRIPRLAKHSKRSSTAVNRK
jgi:hypothetical protein